jgi:cytochrome b561
VLAHLGAALFHGLIRRDGVFTSMASLRREEIDNGT